MGDPSRKLANNFPTGSRCSKDAPTKSNDSNDDQDRVRIIGFDLIKIFNILKIHQKAIAELQEKKKDAPNLETPQERISHNNKVKDRGENNVTGLHNGESTKLTKYLQTLNSRMNRNKKKSLMPE